VRSGARRQSDSCRGQDDHGVWALEGFNALYIVGVTVILHIVAHPVDEQVVRGCVAAEHEAVTVAFALGGAKSRHIADGFGHRLDRLVVDLLLADHCYRLGNAVKDYLSMLYMTNNVCPFDYYHLAGQYKR
jgi:hypothetical protein